MFTWHGEGEWFLVTLGDPAEHLICCFTAVGDVEEGSSHQIHVIFTSKVCGVINTVQDLFAASLAGLLHQDLETQMVCYSEQSLWTLAYLSRLLVDHD